MRMQKKQFRIGQLAKNLKVEKFVIRFWEKEFDIKSTRSEGGQRFYTETDLKKFKLIKELLYNQGYTIAGARRHLKEKAPLNKILGSHRTTIEKSECTHGDLIKELKELKEKLMAMRSSLK